MRRELILLFLHRFVYATMLEPLVQLSPLAGYRAIPSYLLVEDILTALDLISPDQNISYFNISEMGKFTSQIVVQSLIPVPQDISIMFLFNTTSLTDQPRIDFRTSERSVNTIKACLPFDLPKYHYFTDYFLLLPPGRGAKSPIFMSAATMFQREGFDLAKIPLVSENFDRSSPVLVFMFQSTDSLVNWLDMDISNKATYYDQMQRVPDDQRDPANTRITKAILSGSDEFFDNFAKNWQNIGAQDTLVHSMFCQVNEQSLETNYCLHIEGQEIKIGVLSDPSVFEEEKKELDPLSALAILPPAIPGSRLAPIFGKMMAIQRKAYKQRHSSVDVFSFKLSNSPTVFSRSKRDCVIGWRYLFLTTFFGPQTC